MPTVLVVGGGVAAVETAAALRALAESRVEVTVVAPRERFEQRAMSVTAPFALGRRSGRRSPSSRSAPRSSSTGACST